MRLGSFHLFSLGVAEWQNYGGIIGLPNKKKIENSFDFLIGREKRRVFIFHLGILQKLV